MQLYSNKPYSNKHMQDEEVSVKRFLKIKKSTPCWDGSIMHECTSWLTKYTNKKSMHTL